MSDTFDHEGDAYEQQLNAEMDPDYEYNNYTHKSAICKFCKAGDLFWTTVNGKWALESRDRKLHRCLVEKAKTKQAELGFKKKESVTLSIDAINDLLREAAYEDKKNGR
jgi:hypothetical protein